MCHVQAQASSRHRGPLFELCCQGRLVPLPASSAVLGSSPTLNHEPSAHPAPIRILQNFAIQHESTTSPDCRRCKSQGKVGSFSSSSPPREPHSFPAAGSLVSCIARCSSRKYVPLYAPLRQIKPWHDLPSAAKTFIIRPSESFGMPSRTCLL